MTLDASQEIEAAGETRSSLQDTVMSNLQNIATADFICDEIGATPPPGQVIQWILNVDPAYIFQKAQDISNMGRPIEAIAKESPPVLIESLFEGDGADASNSRGWGGDGGEAFERRWKDEFQPNVSKIKTAIDAQAQHVYNVASDFEELQKECKRNIEEHLSDFNEKYEKLVADDEKAETVHDLKTIATETKNIGEKALQIIAGKGKTDIGAGFDSLLTLLGTLQDNVANKADKAATPLMDVQEDTIGQANKDAQFQVLAKSGFTALDPIGGAGSSDESKDTKKELEKEWQSE